MDGYKNINVLRNMLYNVHTKITEIHTTYICLPKEIFAEKKHLLHTLFIKMSEDEVNSSLSN